MADSAPNWTPAGTLSPRQMKALPTIASAPTREAGARRAGVSRSCLFAWLRETAFKAALARFEDEAFSASLERMRRGAALGIEVLVGLARSRRVDDSVRLGAARALVDGAVRVHDVFATSRRLDAIEALLKGSPGAQRETA